MKGSTDFMEGFSGELTQDYYDNTVFPELEKIQDLLQRIKDEQHNIAHKLIHR
jgi:aspartyl/asparaginyl beta-hydroxylase (cupin superfamily)